MEYYIICKRHGYRKDHAMLFWGPNHCGYYYDLTQAGRYTQEQASKFITPAADKPVDCTVIDSLAVESIIDNRKLGKIVLNTKNNREIVGTKLTELYAGPTSWDKRAFCSVDTFLRNSTYTVKLLEDIRFARTTERLCKNNTKDS